MQIQGKELDISIVFNTIAPVEIYGKCTAARNYKALTSLTPHSGNAGIIIKQETLRQKGYSPNNLSRQSQVGWYGPLGWVKGAGLLSLRLNSVYVNRINGRKIEEYFGINLEKWPLSMLHLRFYGEYIRNVNKFRSKMGCDILRDPATTAKKFVEQLRFGRDIEAKLAKTTKSNIDGRAELLKICEIF